MNDDKSRMSWSIKDEAVCAELVTLMGLTAADGAVLQALHGAAVTAGTAMAKEFHGRIVDHANTKQYFEGVDIQRVGAMVAQWFSDLFSGSYGEDYARRRIIIGRTHVRIGLPVRYPLAMLDVVSRHAEPLLAQAADPQAARAAFQKVLALDVAVFNQAYEDTQLKHLSELLGGERLARLLLSN
ncbi:MAG: Globin-coupled histidine kinase [Verrucomicrobia bacterium]|nr:Globin-coupled histidine kinase [Verrucomicrobiota bacterium]